MCLCNLAKASNNQWFPMMFPFPSFFFFLPAYHSPQQQHATLCDRSPELTSFFNNFFLTWNFVAYSLTNRTNVLFRLSFPHSWRMDKKNSDDFDERHDMDDSMNRRRVFYSWSRRLSPAIYLRWLKPSIHVDFLLTFSSFPVGLTAYFSDPVFESGPTGRGRDFANRSGPFHL